MAHSYEVQRQGYDEEACGDKLPSLDMRPQHQESDLVIHHPAQRATGPVSSLGTS